MIKNRLLATSTILGVSLLAMVSNTQHAQAAIGLTSCASGNTVSSNPFSGSTSTITVYSNSASGICDVPNNWTPKLFAWEGRAGAPGGADYEFALGDNGANYNNSGSSPSLLYRDWGSGDNGFNLTWTLDYDSLNKLATFTLGSSSISYTSTTDTGFSPFNAFSLAAKVTGADSKIVSGVKATLNLTSITDTSGISTCTPALNPLCGVLADNTFGYSLNEILLTTSATSISQVTGTLQLSWPGSSNPNTTSARGRVGLVFKAYDPPVTTPNQEPISTPEPGSLVGLLGIAALGLSSLKRKKQQN